MSQSKGFFPKTTRDISLNRSPRGITAEEWKRMYITKQKEIEELVQEYNRMLKELNRVKNHNERLEEQLEKRNDEFSFNDLSFNAYL